VWKGQKNCNCLSAASSPWAQHKKKGRKLCEQVRAPRNPIPREREREPTFFPASGKHEKNAKLLSAAVGLSFFQVLRTIPCKRDVRLAAEWRGNCTCLKLYVNWLV
jgi:hypothetical protein